MKKYWKQILMLLAIVIILPGCLPQCGDNGDDPEDIFAKYQADHFMPDLETRTMYGRDGVKMSFDNPDINKLTCLRERPLMHSVAYREYIQLDKRATTKEKRMANKGKRNFKLQSGSAYWAMVRLSNIFRDKYIKGTPFPDINSKEAKVDLAMMDFMEIKYGIIDEPLNLTRDQERADMIEMSIKYNLQEEIKEFL